MPKTSSRSALWYFATECKNKRGLQGAIPQIIEQVILEWKAMSASEKLPYEELYAKWKRSLGQEKLYNLPSAPTISYKAENVEEKTKSTDDILSKLNSLKLAEVAAKKWYIIKFLTFCKANSNPYKNHKDHNFDYDPYYVLAEVGLIEYSLLNGISKQYHAFIKPTDIPMGWRSHCQDSIESHKIPLGDIGLVKKDYKEIYENILDFVPKDNFEGFFCMEKDIDETKMCLQFLCDCRNNSDKKKRSKINPVYILESLVSALSLKAGRNINKFSAKQLLSAYTYDYSSKTRCEYHDEQSVIACGIGIVKRYAYLISDNICQYYDIKMTEKHLPVEESEGEIVYSNISSKTSSYGMSNKRESEPPSKRSNYDLAEAAAFNSNEEEFPEEFPDDENSESVCSRPQHQQQQQQQVQLQKRQQQLQQLQKSSSTGRVLVCDKLESSVNSSRLSNLSNMSNKTESLRSESISLRSQTISSRSEFMSEDGFSDQNDDNVSDISSSTKTSGSNIKYIGRGRMLPKK